MLIERSNFEHLFKFAVFSEIERNEFSTLVGLVHVMLQILNVLTFRGHDPQGHMMTSKIKFGNCNKIR